MRFKEFLQKFIPKKHVDRGPIIDMDSISVTKISDGIFGAEMRFNRVPTDKNTDPARFFFQHVNSLLMSVQMTRGCNAHNATLNNKKLTFYITAESGASFLSTLHDDELEIDQSKADEEIKKNILLIIRMVAEDFNYRFYK